MLIPYETLEAVVCEGMSSADLAEDHDSSGVEPDVIEKTQAINLNDTVGSETMADALREGATSGLSGMGESEVSLVSEAPPSTITNQPFPATSTKVYYHIDDEPTPYLTEVHVPPDLITLGDVKRVLMRSNFKYYCKALDQDTGCEVKAEIRDDMEWLHRSSNGRFELFLLTTEGSTHSDGSSGLPKTARHHMVPGPAPTSMYHLSQNAYRQAVHQYDNSLLSTDSESMVSAPVPQYMKGSLNRRHVQQQYIITMTTASSLTRKASSKELITSSIVERTNFLMDFIGERRQSQRSVAPLMYSKGEFAFQNKSRVAQLVSRLENASTKKPPLAVPEVVDSSDEPKKLKRKYAKHLTSTKILHSIFGRDSEKKKSDPTLAEGRVVALTGGAIREPVVLRNRQNGGSLGSKSENSKSTQMESSRIRSLIKKRRSEGCIAVPTDETLKKQRSKTSKQSDGFSSHMKSSRSGSALVDISRRDLDLKEGEDIILRPLEPRLEDRPIPSLVIEKKSSPDLSAPTGTFLEECQFPLRRRPYNTIGGGPLMKCERRMLHSRPLSRTMTAVENRILPPLYENGGTSEDQQQKRPKKRYMGSHTTSSFQGKNDTEGVDLRTPLLAPKAMRVCFRMMMTGDQPPRISPPSHDNMRTCIANNDGDGSIVDPREHLRFLV
ncbi:DIX domain protein [Teladorsagia circumcincta]|uniref:DIX domain protein n=1 Tax=Teladorsagia circumcincta TaxID=45464 RepID=A0A2G9UTF5_TELCI|nr:DIX domain protein [Teladorsagia circumcincta]